MKAIETNWKGFRFRSRLEARWAVFFETLGLTWRYEHQGIEVGGELYLPDFEVDNPASRRKWFVEVKGNPGDIAQNRTRYSRLLTGQACLPHIVFLGDIPEPKGGTWFHPVLMGDGHLEDERLARKWCIFSTAGVYPLTGGPNFLEMLCGIPSVGGKPDDWLVEARHVETPLVYPGADKAYRAARSARFEHGETP